MAVRIGRVCDRIDKFANNSQNSKQHEVIVNSVFEQNLLQFIKKVQSLVTMNESTHQE